MKLGSIIEGLTIFSKYFDNGMEHYSCNASHEILYVFPTDKTIEKNDLDRLIELGWIQQDAFTGDDEEFSAKYYDQGENWCCYL